MHDTEAERQGKVFVSTGLGGGGSTDVMTNNIAKKGVVNFCVHGGVLNHPPKEEQGISLLIPNEHAL